MAADASVPLVVRAARLEDLAAVAAVAAASWHATYGGFLRRVTIEAFLRGAYSEVALRRTLDAGGLWTLHPLEPAAPAGVGAPVGYTRLSTVDGRGSVGAIYLLPAWLRRGGGRLLLEHAFARFTAQGFSTHAP